MLKTWLITPIVDNDQLSETSLMFNTNHSKCRIIIERAFAMLKQRFHRLHFIDTRRMHATVLYIGAMTILHNYCIKNEDDTEFIVDDLSIGEELKFDIASDSDDDDEEDYMQLSKAEQKRQKIINNILC